MTGTDGAAVPYNCQFVPSGPNSCDTLQGYDRRYVTYGTFADLYPGDSQMPYKPLTLESASRPGQLGVALNIDWQISETLFTDVDHLLSRLQDRLVVRRR